MYVLSRDNIQQVIELYFFIYSVLITWHTYAYL